MKLDEKAVSVAQRRLFGIALAVKRGDKSIGDFENQDAIRQIMKLPDKELKKFAKTKEKDLPKKVAKEALFQELRKFAGLTEQKARTGSPQLKLGANLLQFKGVDLDNFDQAKAKKAFDKFLSEMRPMFGEESFGSPITLKVTIEKKR